MKCWIYRSKRKPDHYVFSDRPNDLEHVPAALQVLLSPLDLVMSLELTPARRLANADTAAVLTALRETGFYLQIPPRDIVH